MPTREMPGASLFNVSSIFPKIESSISENPVTLRPGRARLSTAPDAIGSVVNATTIGIERVNFVRTGMTRSPTITMTFGFSSTRFAASALTISMSPVVVELNVPALGPSQPCQFLPESPNVRLIFRVAFRVGHQDANPPHLTGLLCARRERPSGHRAAECSQQFPPSDGDCHTPLPCEVRKGKDTTPRACCPNSAAPGAAKRLDFKRFIFGRAVGRALINAGIGRMSALGANRTCRDGRNDVNDPKPISRPLDCCCAK